MKEELINGIITSFVNYGEKDRIVRIISPEKGQISFMAKNARASKKRFAGVLDVGNQIECTLTAPASGQLWKIHDVDLLEGFSNIHKDIKKLAVMLYCCEVTSVLAPTEEPSAQLFGLLHHSLNLLNQIPTPNNAFHWGFTIKSLCFAGLQPQLDTCVHCGKPISTSVSFHPLLGGVIDNQCRKNIIPEMDKKSVPCSLSWLENIGHLLHSPLSESFTRTLKNGNNWALSRCIEEQTERALQSVSFLKTLYPN